MTRGVRVGLTGGIGSGKSTVAGVLAQRGAWVIDADALSRTVTAAGGVAIPAIAKAFGNEIITADGALDRARMRSMVFTDPAARKQLETIVHPLVNQAIARSAECADAQGASCLVYDIPLLVESAHWRASLDSVVVIDCEESSQIRRVCQRNGLQESDVIAILAAQSSRVKRLQGADHVICNEAISLQQLERLVKQFGAQFGL